MKERNKERKREKGTMKWSGGGCEERARGEREEAKRAM